MYKKIDSKVVYRHPRLTIEEDTIELEDGTIDSYIRYGEGSGVVIIARDSKERTAFVREYSYALQNKIINLPQGGIKKDEKPEVAATRELKEETGLHANNLVLVGKYYKDNRRNKDKNYVYLATDLEKHESIPDKEESGIELLWLTDEEIGQYVTDETIKDIDSISALYFAHLYDSTNHSN